MITPELIQYVRSRVAVGVSKGDIEKSLLPNGWSPQEIDQAFLSVSSAANATSRVQPVKSSSFAGRKILLSFGFLVSSALYAFYQYVTHPPEAQQTLSMTTAPQVPETAQAPVVIIAQPQEQVPPVPTPAPVRATPVSVPVSAPTLVPKPAPVPVSKPVPVPTPVPTSKPMGQYVDGTYTGSPANAYYGTVQVAAVIQNGKLADVQILQYPQDRGTSVRINSRALPILQREAVATQKANVDAVSGASDTSPAFIQSLSSALVQAKN